MGSLLVRLAVALTFATIITILSTTAAAFSLQSQVQELVECYAQHDRPSRSLLQRRHSADFQGDSLFQSFARLVCRANAVPRKELFETWSTAVYIQEKFQDRRRIADLCCGHSLLSFALLFLDENNPRSTNHVHGPRTAVCIDKRMPPSSCGKIASVMFTQFPQFEARWDFVEGKLDAITTTLTSSCPNAQSQTLLCGIHACGRLSDKIISLAVEMNTPLALVPCCHTKKSLEDSERIFYDRDASSYDLSEFVDRRRMERLSKARYDVEQQSIPEQFTPKNRLILASPPTVPRNPLPSPVTTSNRHSFHPSSFPQMFSIPIDDSAESRTIIRSMAGRRQLPAPSLCVSLAMPAQDSVTTLKLSARASELFRDEDRLNSTTVENADTEPFWHASSGKYFRTFRITYRNGESLAIKKDDAKGLHESLCKEIPVAFPGTKVRSQ